MKNKFGLESQQQEVTVDTAIQLLDNESKDDNIVDNGSYIDINADVAVSDAVDGGHQGGVLIQGMDQLQSYDAIIQKNEISGTSLSEESFKLLDLSLSATCERLNLKGSISLPSMESFSNPHTAIPVLKISRESIADTAKSVMKKVIEFFRNLWKKIFNFMTGLINKAEQERAERAQKVLDAQISKDMKNCSPFKISNPTLLAAYFSEDAGNKVSMETVQEILSNSINFLSVMEQIGNLFHSYIGDIALTTRNIGRFIDETLADGQIHAEAYVNDMKSILDVEFFEIVQDIVNARKFSGPVGLAHALSKSHGDVIVTKGLLNNSRFVFSKKEEVGGTFTIVTLVKDTTVSDQVKGLSIDTPTFEEMTTINRLNSRLLDEFNSFSKTGLLNKVNSDIEKLLSEMSLLSHKVDRVSNANKAYVEIGEKVKSLLSCVNAFLRFYSEFEVKGLNIIKSTNNVTQQFLSNVTTAYKQQKKST